MSEEPRLEKLQRLKELGHDPYLAEEYTTTHFPAEIHAGFEALEGKPVSLAGRVTSLRNMGKAAFADITRDGERVQIYVKKDDVGEALWEAFSLVDIGDIIGVSGEVFKTRTEETSIHARDLRVLAKCLHTLPLGKEKDGERWYGLSDVEERYRRRYVDMLANPDSRDLLLKRSKIISATRRFLDERGFIEVETPVLQTEAGGAAARPFRTFHNALEMELKLRISLELYLKRMLVAGVDKVYEIGRVFRNEGISTRHNPEFTMLELYQAYVKMEDIQLLVEELCRKIAKDVFGSEVITVDSTALPRGESSEGESPRERGDSSVTLDFSKPFRRVDLLGAIQAETGIAPETFQDLAAAKKAMAGLGLPTEDENDVGGIIEKLLERFVEPKLIQPTFLENYPIETSPLAKKCPDNPLLTRRFEGYLLGREFCNAFGELNDPIDQRERLELQAAQLAAGNHEANPLDEDFLYALEIGMPPAGGLGIGMDRLAFLMAGAESIRDVILFPTLRPQSH